MEEEPVLTYKLHLQATLGDLASIREFVESSVLAAGCAPTDAPMLVLAVDEAVTNIIVHGYGGRGGPVDIGIGQQNGAVLICLRDEAPPFDPTDVAAPDIKAPLDRRPPGGLGIYLMRQIADTVSYRARPEGGNEIVLLKRRA